MEPRPHSASERRRVCGAGRTSRRRQWRLFAPFPARAWEPAQPGRMQWRLPSSLFRCAAGCPGHSLRFRSAARIFSRPTFIPDPAVNSLGLLVLFLGPEQVAFFDGEKNIVRISVVSTNAGSATTRRDGPRGAETPSGSSSRRCWFQCCPRLRLADTQDPSLCFRRDRPRWTPLHSPGQAADDVIVGTDHELWHRYCAGRVRALFRDRGALRRHCAAQKTRHARSGQYRLRIEPG